MSSMLEQAIIDAAALKEAAMKNAESIIIDKYSADVKKVVETLLEQDDMDDDAMDMEEEPLDAPDENDVMDQVPAAHSTGEVGEEEMDALRDAVESAEEALDNVTDKLDDIEMTSVAGGDQEVEIDLDQLRQQMDAEEEVTADDMVDREEMAAELPEEPAMDDAPAEEEPTLDLDEDILDAIVKELRVDVDPQASGWLNRPDGELEHAADQILAREQDDEVKEENEELRAAAAKLQKENKELNNKNATTTENNTKLRQTILHLKEKFDEINLSNARLLYTNKVLSSTSLNERQKTQIVEAISKADTIEEAKVIYETLQSATGAMQTDNSPKSLSEAVQRNSSSTLVSRNRKREENVSDSVSERMKKLAGIY